MFYTLFKKKVLSDKSSKPSSSEFSDFFRKATSREKKRVFNDVAKKASDKQRAYVN